MHEISHVNQQFLHKDLRKYFIHRFNFIIPNVREELFICNDLQTTERNRFGTDQYVIGSRLGLGCYHEDEIGRRLE